MRFLKAGDLDQLVQAIHKVASSGKIRQLRNSSKGTSMASVIPLVVTEEEAWHLIFICSLILEMKKTISFAGVEYRAIF